MTDWWSSNQLLLFLLRRSQHRLFNSASSARTPRAETGFEERRM